MIFLETADIIVVASRVLGVDVREALDLLDVDAAEAALAEAHREGRPAAASLLFALIRHRPFARGNERVAVFTTLQFLALNGRELDLDPSEEAMDVVAGVASGAIGRAELEAWVSSRIRPLSRRDDKEDRMFHRRGRGSRRPSGKGPFGRFTDKACESVTRAQEEARLLRHDYLGTEHLLLGLMRVHEGVAAKALDALGVSPAAVRTEIEEIVGVGNGSPPGSIPLTPRTKKVLELSLREALQLGHNYVGTEHVLLGILREGEGVAAHVLERLGVDLSHGRQTVVQLLARHEQRPHDRVDLSLGEFEGSFAVGGTDANVVSRSALIGGIDAVFDENDRLRSEVEHLRMLLRQHGIEPDGGETRSA